MSSKVIDESPHLVLPTLAVEIGLNNAVFMQQIHFLCERSKAAKVHKGRRWIRRTLSQLQEEFPYWSIRTIQRAIDKLKAKHLIETTQDLNKHASDRGMWITVHVDRVATSSGQDGQIDVDKMATSTSGQDGHMYIEEDREDTTPPSGSPNETEEDVEDTTLPDPVTQRCVEVLRYLKTGKKMKNGGRDMIERLRLKHPLADAEGTCRAAVSWAEDEDQVVAKPDNFLKSFFQSAERQEQERREEDDQSSWDPTSRRI